MGPPKQSESNAEAKAREDHNPESKAPLIDQPVAAAPTDNVVNPLGSTDDRKDRTVGSMSSPIIPAIGPNSKANAQNSKTWRGGGTWRRGGKATPVTEVAKESILAATDKASEVFSSAGNTAAHIGVKRTASPSIYLSRSLRGSNRSLPTFASATKVSATSDSLASPVGSFQQSAMSGTALAQGRDSTVERLDTGEKRKRDPEPQPHPPDDRTPPKRDEQEGRAENEALTWRGWFLRTGEPTKAELSKPADTTDDPTPKPANQTRRRNSDPSATTTNGKEEHLPRSWLGLWAATRSAKAESADGATLTVVESPTKPSSSSRAVTPNTEDAHVAQGPQGTFTNNYPGWAFWSRQPPGKTVGDVDPSNQGELVLAESSINVSSTPPVSDATKGVSDKKPRLVGSVCKDQTPQAQAQAETLSSPTKKLKTTSEIEPLQESNTSISSTNLLLPPIVATYRPAPRQSWLEALSQWWQDDRSSKTNRVQLLPKPPRIKKALAIGIHGYFPAPLIRSVLGQPTGTSVRFADGAASAIQSWTSGHGYQCEIEKVALEGEGRILERVDLLWKLLLNWIDNIRRADFVMVACHSQGVPVAIMLIAKLIEFGCVHDARIGVCAMAGVNLGPFIDFKSRWIGGSAGELFEFARPDSQVSKDYHAALTKTLKFGTKVAYIGSIDDQLVSLESSTFGTVDHPHIYRAVFVDGRIHAPDFLTHLVGFALKLRNLGVSDHGLIRELSSPLAGSLYGGEGHSRIYEDDAVYFLAVQNALETTTIGGSDVKKVQGGVSSPHNPYILPFSLRGVLEEDYVRNELHEETMELLRQFDEWKPSTKVLKDVKFRLEGVRSKL